MTTDVHITSIAYTVYLNMCFWLLNSVGRRLRMEIIWNRPASGLSAVRKNSTVNVRVYQKQEEAIFREVSEYPKHPFAYVPGGLQNTVTLLLLSTARTSCGSRDLRSLVNRSRCTHSFLSTFGKAVNTYGRCCGHILHYFRFSYHIDCKVFHWKTYHLLSPDNTVFLDCRVIEVNVWIFCVL